ncbi:MAG: response regulator [Firmicutes bacterium]|nr:response regulator [Bacillota bacterium]
MARVLIADDSAVARKILREIVISLGHVVVGEVPNGSQAFVEYSKLKPDVVTMDLTMQGLGGAEATSKIIATFPEARIIVISAMEERRVVIDSLERGARHFIIKPISKEKVAAVLNNVLHQEVDLKKHIERVRKMKGSDDLSPMTGSVADKYLSPYFIRAQGDNLVHVVINSNITLISCQSLALELEEHLTGKSRVLLDFGTMLTLDKALLAKLNELVETIINNSGIVKAISNNKEFVESIAKIQIGNKANLVGDVLRYFAN